MIITCFFIFKVIRSDVVRENVQGLIDLLTAYTPNLTLQGLTDDENEYDDEEEEEEDGGWSDFDQSQETTLDTDFSQLSDNEAEPKNLVSNFF